MFTRCRSNVFEDLKLKFQRGIINAAVITNKTSEILIANIDSVHYWFCPQNCHNVIALVYKKDNRVFHISHVIRF